MATVDVQCICGCGRKFGSVEEAALHSDEKSHKMDIRGMITPVTRKVKAPKTMAGLRSRGVVSPRANTSTRAYKSQEDPEYPVFLDNEALESGFDNLRARLGSRIKPSYSNRT